MLFSQPKPLIAMVHLPPLPGTPLYDASRGIGGLISAVQRDLEVLLEAGFDAFLIGESVMKSADPSGPLLELIGPGCAGGTA